MEHFDSFVHPSFSISGRPHNRESLKKYAVSLLESHELWQQLIGQFFRDWLDPSPHILIKTSGTTKESRGFKMKKEALVAHAQMSCDFFKLQPKDRIAHVLSTDFIAGKMILVRALTRGLDLWCFKPSKSPLDGVEVYFDWVSMVPMQLAHSLPAMAKIKNLLIGGAPMSEQLKSHALTAATSSGCEIFVSFGMSETLSHIAIAKLEQNKAVVFKTLPGISISINSESCLHIEAPYLSELVKTSDVVELVGTNAFKWLGRSDYLINSGGVKLHPEIIEREFSLHFKESFFFCGIPDSLLGEKLCLVVLDQHKELAEEQLKNIRFSIPYYKPKSILAIPDFAITSSGKIKRKQSLMAGYEEYSLS
ncbi:MAG: 2-succinylbenzoate--CoA ligase [SAR116 cluster bacterium]|jgi:O-succinylbenzoic acid--CoA ligase|nr:MAG: 2-succinylbenzoate--CoA ligase [SAR116 cluster bacterium]